MRLILLVIMLAILSPALDGRPLDRVKRSENKNRTLTVIIDTGAIATEAIPQPGDFEVAIELKRGVIQGAFVWVDVYLNRQTAPIGGYNLVMTYDTKELIFQQVDFDSTYLIDECGWEYCTYRVGEGVGCEGDCPEGLIQVRALADVDKIDGDPRQSCINDSIRLFKMRFLVTNDRTYECKYMPIRFFWSKCDDNYLLSTTGDTLFVAHSVQEYDTLYHDYNRVSGAYSDSALPSIYGPTADCDKNDTVQLIHSVDFKNGRLAIVCNDLDPSGDLNLDGLPYTLPDVEMFADYFMRDTVALTFIEALNQYGRAPGYSVSIAYSDVNHNGVPLEISDFQFLINVIVGERMMKVNPRDSISFDLHRSSDGSYSTDRATGAVFMKFKGEIAPTLLTDVMQMKQHFDGENTCVLIWSPEGHSFSGKFIKTDAELVSVEMTTPEAELVRVELPPDHLVLYQNQPNPFSGVTTIRFGLPEETECEIEIVRLSDNTVVASYKEEFEAGYAMIQWDGSDQAPGEYLFRIKAGELEDSIYMRLSE